MNKDNNPLMLSLSMKKNVGDLDQTIRAVLAVIIAILFFTNAVSGTMAIILLIFSAGCCFTCLVRICPLYTVLGLSTKKDSKS